MGFPGKVGTAGATAAYNTAMAMLAWGSMMFHSSNIDVGHAPIYCDDR